MSFFYLASDDFFPGKTEQGDILCNRIPGFSLILFYSTRCDKCRVVFPIFRDLPKTIIGCAIGVINVSKNKSCVNMSKETITPIRYVPYMVLYLDGVPLMVYAGRYDRKEIAQFVYEISSEVQRKRQRIAQESKRAQKQIGINRYHSVLQKHERKGHGCTGGIPVYGEENDDVCYLVARTAYSKLSNRGK